MKKANKSPELTVEQCINIIDIVIPMIATDVRRAIGHMEMLEGSNWLASQLSGVQTQAAEGVNLSQNAFLVMLALDVSRIFDPVSIDKDKASLPLLYQYFCKDGVQSKLIDRFKHYGPTKSKNATTSLMQFCRSWKALLKSNRDQNALSKLRILRNNELAHSLHGKQPEAPTYGNLFRLVKIAHCLTCLAENTTDKGLADLRNYRRNMKPQTLLFWKTIKFGIENHI